MESRNLDEYWLFEHGYPSNRQEAIAYPHHAASALHNPAARERLFNLGLMHLFEEIAANLPV
jgi:hypothetical protein